jgi:hypothetical protein
MVDRSPAGTVDIPRWRMLDVVREFLRGPEWARGRNLALVEAIDLALSPARRA